jgi:hypothetical protein
MCVCVGGCVFCVVCLYSDCKHNMSVGGPVPDEEKLDQVASGKVRSAQNKFLPPATPKTSAPTDSVANLLEGIRVVQKRENAPVALSSADEAVRTASVGESAPSDPLQPQVTGDEVRPAEVFGLVALAVEVRESDPERGFVTPTTFEAQFSVLAKEGRMMVMCGKEMVGFVDGCMCACVFVFECICVCMCVCVCVPLANGTRKTSAFGVGMVLPQRECVYSSCFHGTLVRFDLPRHRPIHRKISLQRNETGAALHTVWPTFSTLWWPSVTCCT